MGVVSGRSGALVPLTSHPANFQRQGYLTMQSGKVWHTEEGDLFGMGMPPNQDAAGGSWDAGCSMAGVNSVAPMLPCAAEFPGTQGCPINATLEGEVLDGTGNLCDKVISDDAIAKLRLAAATLKATGRPFYLASGFRKPHMPWRFPAPYAELYPPPDEIALAAHPTMDASVPPIAHHTPDLQFQEGGNPYVMMNDSIARRDRLYYYAAVSWVDSRVGAVLDELDALDLAESTLVIMHSDHGWNLGEHGQWQKFTNWETGVRVPLMIRAPWLPASAGRVTHTLAELVDVYPTAVDLAGADGPPAGETPLDGVSLGWVLRAPSAEAEAALESGGGAGKAAVLSQFGRCPLAADKAHPAWITNTSEMWMNNWCEFVDRSEIPWMGFSMRTAEWRYTEWAAWNGTALRPDWSTNAGVELYDHRGDNGTNFDATENVNVAKQNADIVAQLSTQLHALVASQP